MSSDDIQSSSYADSQEIQTSDADATTESFIENSPSSNQSNSFAQKESAESEQRFEQGEIFKSDSDKKLHREILEKLDIIKKEQTQGVQDNSMREKQKNETYPDKINNQEKSQTKTQIEDNLKMSLSQDFEKVQKLVKAGLINSKQGQNLKKQVLKEAFDKLVQTEKIKRTLSPASPTERQISQQANNQASRQNVNEVFEEFSSKNPDFFTSDGRKEVLNYLKSGDVNIGRDELSKISDIIRTVEKAAIDRYLKKVSHEETLRNSNEVAKKRLTANAQKSGFSDKNLLRSFTREQIGKMNSAEFAKYEPYIMEQLKKGLIR